MTGRDPATDRSASTVTYHAAERAYRTTLGAARERFEELTLRDLMAGSLAKLQARGEYDSQRHPATDDYQPLTPAERLEVLALGEVLARYYRHPAHVHDAVTTGASWEQVAAALNCTEDQARRDYRTWAEGQHHLWITYQGRFGLDDGQYTAAVDRAPWGGSPLPGPGETRVAGCAGCRARPVAQPGDGDMYGRFCADCIEFCEQGDSPDHHCAVCADAVGLPVFYLEENGHG